jgi:carbonic anhydrase/acetyltransferase-like protein (isoleucine patch superfamily)
VLKVFKPRTLVIALTVVILAFVAVTQVHRQPAVASGGTCNPTSANRPICPSTAPSNTATFLDPTVTVSNPGNITLGEKVYVAPFAELNATNGSIRISEDSNVQDQVRIIALGTGVQIGPRVIMAHMATVKGATYIGTQGSTGPFTDPITNTQFNNDPAETFLAFNCEVDGATVEKNTVVNFLSRVGPGVTLPAGKVVLPGKNVTTNQQASDGSLGKVADLTQADVSLMQGIIEVNEAFAKGYSDLATTNLSNVTGINLAPVTSFNPGGLPKLNGVTTQNPTFRNRIIGDVVMQDSLNRLNKRMGNRISLRGDEGHPFNIGNVFMADDVVLHALEETNLTLGSPVGYAPRALVHGGRQVVNGVANGPETSIGNLVGLGPNSVVFRSVIGAVSAIGEKSAVFNSTLPQYTFINNNTIYANNGAIISPVEW